MSEAITKALEDFERKERGIPQAHMAAQLVAELRAALSQAGQGGRKHPDDDGVFAYLDSEQGGQGEVSDSAIDAATRHIYHDGRLVSKEYRVGIARAALALYAAQPAPVASAAPMSDAVRRSYECLLAMNTPNGFKDRIGPFVQWLQDNRIAQQTAPAVPADGEALQLLREILDNSDASLLALGEVMRTSGLHSVVLPGKMGEAAVASKALMDRARALLSAAPKPAVPDGYALVSVDALRSWGRLDEVNAACIYPVGPAPKPEHGGGQVMYTKPQKLALSRIEELAKEAQHVVLNNHKDMGSFTEFRSGFGQLNERLREIERWAEAMRQEGTAP